MSGIMPFPPFPEIPLPPIDKWPVIGWVLDKGKKILKKILGIDDELSKTSAVNFEKSTADDIMDISSMMTEYRLEVKNESKEFEKQIQRVFVDVCDQVCESIEFANEKFNLYNTDRLQRKRDNFIDDIDGIFERHVSANISLDNSRCTGILKMPAGTLKTERMAELKRDVFSETIEDICKKLSDFSSDIFDGMEMSIDARLDNIESKLTEKSESFRKISENNDERDETHQAVMMQAGYMLALSQLAERDM